jgi:hypothetical protein
MYHRDFPAGGYSETVRFFDQTNGLIHFQFDIFWQPAGVNSQRAGSPRL